MKVFVWAGKKNTKKSHLPVHTLLLIIDRIYFTHKQTHFEVLRYQKIARSYSNMSICC